MPYLHSRWALPGTSIANIPEAIQHPRELSLTGSRSALHGSHLTLTASEDIPANGHGGPTTSAHRAAKAALRQEMRARRRAFVATLSPAELTVALTALSGRVEPHLKGARIVAGYMAMNGEVDPSLILTAAHQSGIATALPLVESREAPLQFRRWSPGDALVQGPFGLLQPAASAEPVDPDLILAPLVAFDRALGRLGQGASHYDRAFVKLPQARRIGLAWSAQEVVDPLPADAWDIPLHAVATEREWITA